ncbi:hypothetical protein [Alloactinosynnema sp. L-07]|nr:hypothetical protein [Alloactinosynnema sp. L-07]
MYQYQRLVEYTGWATAGCANGHYTRPSVKIQGRSSSLEFRTRVQISVNGRTVYNALGPATKCC